MLIQDWTGSLGTERACRLALFSNGIYLRQDALYLIA
jgi:hypothetical protein